MSYTSDQLRALLKQPESEELEFKESIRDGGTLGRLISAFANARGGRILIGVRQDGQVVGANISAVSKAFHLALAGLVNPPKVDLEATPIDGKQVAVITVSKGDRLTVSEGGAFQRVRDRVEPMEVTGIVQLLSQHGAAEPVEAQGLAEAIHRLTFKIESLEVSVAYSNSFRGQLRNNLVSGLIGWVLGFALSYLVR